MVSDRSVGYYRSFLRSRTPYPPKRELGYKAPSPYDKFKGLVPERPEAPAEEPIVSTGLTPRQPPPREREETIDLGEGLRMTREGKVYTEGMPFPIGQVDLETGKFRKTWQGFMAGGAAVAAETVERLAYPVTVSGMAIWAGTEKERAKQALPTETGEPPVDPWARYISVTEEVERAIEKGKPVSEYQKQILAEPIPPEYKIGGEKYQEYRELPLGEQLLYELPGWTAVGALIPAAGGIRTALYPTTIFGKSAIVRTAAQLAHAGLAPVAAMEAAGGLAIRGLAKVTSLGYKGSSFITSKLYKYSGLKSLKTALDTKSFAKAKVLLNDFVARIEAGGTIEEVEWATYKKLTNRNVYEQTQVFLSSLKAAREQQTIEVALREASAKRAATVREIIQDTDINIVTKEADPGLYKALQEAGGGWILPDSSIEAVDRFEKIGLHELGHKIAKLDLPAEIHEVFYKEFAAWGKGEALRLEATKSGQNFWRKKGFPNPEEVYFDMIAIQNEVKADLVSRAIQGKPHENFPRFIKAVADWLEKGAPGRRVRAKPAPALTEIPTEQLTTVYKAFNVDPAATAVEAVGKGTYVSPSFEGAALYGTDIRQVQVFIKKPFVVYEDSDLIGSALMRGYEGARPTRDTVIAWLKKEGYDAVIMKTRGADHINIINPKAIVGEFAPVPKGVPPVASAPPGVPPPAKPPAPPAATPGDAAEQSFKEATTALVAYVKTIQKLIPQKELMQHLGRKENAAKLHQLLRKAKATGDFMSIWEESNTLLAGKLKAPKMLPLPEQIKPDQINKLFEYIYYSDKIPERLVMNRHTADEALRKILGIHPFSEPVMPAPAELATLEMVFGEDLVKLIASKAPMKTKAWDLILEAINIPKATMASVDLSAMFRQGGILLYGHPTTSLPAAKDMVKAFIKPKYGEEVTKQIMEDPYYMFATAVPDKYLFLAGLTDYMGLAVREEAFLSPHFAGKIPFVARSEAAFVTYLNKARFDTFKSIVQSWERSGKDLRFSETVATWSPKRQAWKFGKQFIPEDQLAAYAKQRFPTQVVRKEGKSLVAEGKDLWQVGELAQYINRATGRGDIKALRSWMVGLNALMFSPRLFLSRFQLPLSLFSRSPAVRKMAARDIAAFTAANLTILGLANASGVATVELDPRSTDFLKIRIGNHRINFWSGYQPVMRLAGQLILGMHQWVTGRTDFPEVLRITTTGREMPVTVGELAGRFMEGKSSPAASILKTLMTGEVFMGDRVFTDSDRALIKEQLLPAVERLINGDLTAVKDIDYLIQQSPTVQFLFDNSVPLFIEDVLEALREEGVIESLWSGKAPDWARAAKGLAIAAPGGVGADIQTYDSAIQVVGEVYGHMTKFQSIQSEARKIYERGDMKSLAKFIADNPEAQIIGEKGQIFSNTYRFLSQTTRNLGKLQDERDKLMADQVIDIDEKRLKIDQIDRLMIGYSVEALIEMDRIMNSIQR